MSMCACVRQVISEHYNDQLRILREEGFEQEAELRALIKKNRDDEVSSNTKERDGWMGVGWVLLITLT